MSYHLFLDDERMPQDVTWVSLPLAPMGIVRNYDQFVEQITTYAIPKFVTFDHDLADEHYQAMLKDNDSYTAFIDDDMGGMNVTFDYGKEMTGFDCAKWLIQYCIDQNHKFPEYQVHSMNPVGSKRIHDYIEWAKTKFNFL